ncbi:MAG: four helix bundle protein [Bacteroidia bacterium]|nr:four helix bundle protein [Bacteroidia bacterium]
MKRFEDIQAWQLARILAQDIHKQCQSSLFAQDFPLKDQIRRAAGSVMDNIAEGFARNGNKEFSQHLSIAKASAAEVQSQLYRALDQHYLTQTQFNQLYSQADHIIAMITKLMQYLKTTTHKGPKYDPPTP